MERIPKAGPGLRLSNVKIATMRRNGEGLGEKIFIADNKTSRGTSAARSLFIVRRSWRRRRNMSSHAEHVDTWASAARKARPATRSSAISVRVSSEMCVEVFIPILQARCPCSTDPVASHKIHFPSISLIFGVTCPGNERGSDRCYPQESRVQPLFQRMTAAPAGKRAFAAMFCNVGRGAKAPPEPGVALPELLTAGPAAAFRPESLL